jgi:hypothetical protein
MAKKDVPTSCLSLYTSATRRAEEGGREEPRGLRSGSLMPGRGNPSAFAVVGALLATLDEGGDDLQRARCGDDPRAGLPR